MENFKVLPSRDVSAQDMQVIRGFYGGSTLTPDEFTVIQFKIADNEIHPEIGDRTKLSDLALRDFCKMAIGITGTVYGKLGQARASIYKAFTKTNKTIKTIDGGLFREVYVKAVFSHSPLNTNPRELAAELRTWTKTTKSVGFIVERTREASNNGINYHIADKIQQVYGWKLSCEH